MLDVSARCATKRSVDRRFAALVAIVALSGAACTVLNDLDGYAGGTKDTGTAPIDTGTIDSSVRDTGSPAEEDTFVEPTTMETSVDSMMVVDSAMDSVAMDSVVMDTSDGGTDAVVPDAVLGCHAVINEIQTRSVATGLDEFIELYNPCDTAVSLASWKLVYRSAAGMTESVVVPSFAATASIPSKGFFLVANASSAFAAMADATFTTGIADIGGVALRDPGGATADSVTWGAVAVGHPFTEKATAPEPTSGASIARQPTGVDSNDNSADFKKITPATPKAG
jgi:hypothetical protein